MKPEHTRPFNREHAEAGAPYACASGLEAHILRWHKDGAIGYFVGLADAEISAGWRNDGHRRAHPNQGEHDLVMVPLGMCQGKPVWWMDKLIHPVHGEFEASQPGWTYECATWPVAAPVIETKMTDAELCAAWNADTILGGISPVRHRALADAVLGRAIADGQVVPMWLLEDIAAEYAESVPGPGGFACSADEQALFKKTFLQRWLAKDGVK